ncbi:hypothetical protein EXU57_19510 [Segetibacter sp. 3557_3]|uniref:tail fiber domain-containing protein n=1 Tax=Segetibacter sp. 3557_3 TaxID=2547429 RepID=UPI001058AD88|nr:tail fiber domain-containing protein [Segetibacter sp. 3557_3]TDH21389.1 hypothetical protein EXU57_19510 [Segetibacter sp. 3557_3]
MKFFLLFLGIFLTSTNLFSQGNVGIGTTTPSNKLHVTGAPDPLRIEGVASGAGTDSVLTINATGVVKRRNASLFAGTAGWSLTGNSGLSATNNFIGTTNLSPFIIRTNNQRSGFIDADSTRRNTSLGNRALNTAVTGPGNSAIGYLALARLTSGASNVAVGDSSGLSLTTGSDNSLIGSDAGYLLTVGGQNTAIGSRALASAVAGSNNIAIGYRTLENNFASSNIAIGSTALDNNTSGSSNIGIGLSALGANTTASTNVAVGHEALPAVTTGADNLGLGYRSGYSLTTGTQNTLLGHFTLSSHLTSNYSTMVGYQAGANLAGGNNNTFIGYNTDASIASVSNSAAFGSGATVTASNMIRIGGTGVTVISGPVGFSNTSDERVKSNIRENVPGLNFISLLRPVTYNYNLQKMDELQGVKQGARTTNMAREKIRYTGFIAQEVLKAAEKVNYETSAVNVPDNANTLYSLNYAELVVPLVKAVQELKSIVEKQQQEIELLKKSLQGK